jgi:hypothetical protein
MGKKYMMGGMMHEDTPLFEIPSEGVEAYVAKCAAEAAALAFQATNGDRPAIAKADQKPRQVIEQEAFERQVKLNELIAGANAKDKNERSLKEAAALVLAGTWEAHKTTMDKQGRYKCEVEFLDMLDGGNYKCDIVYFLIEFSPMPRQSLNGWWRQYCKDLKKNREKEQDALRWTMAEDEEQAGGEGGSDGGGNSSLPSM